MSGMVLLLSRLSASVRVELCSSVSCFTPRADVSVLAPALRTDFILLHTYRAWRTLVCSVSGVLTSRSLVPVALVGLVVGRYDVV